MPQGNPAGYNSPQLSALLGQLLGMQRQAGPFGGALQLPQRMVHPLRMQASNTGDMDLVQLLEMTSGQRPTIGGGGGDPFAESGDGRMGEPLGVEPSPFEKLFPFGGVSGRGLYDPNQTMRAPRNRNSGR